MLDLGKIYSGGSLAKPHKGYALGALQHWKANGYKRVIIPCSGSLAIANLAQQAGFRPEDIYCSDIALYPTLLGALASHTPLADLGIEVEDPSYTSLQSDRKKVAWLLLHMKIAQLKDDNYEGAVKRELIDSSGKYLARLENDLELKTMRLKGINYELRDLRDVVANDGGDDAIMIVNPPAYGVDSPQDPPPDIQFDPGISWWDAGMNWPGDYDTLRDQGQLVLWRRINEITDIPSREVVFALEKSKKIDYWLCTKPELLADWGHSPVALRPKKELKPYPAPIWTAEDRLTEDSTIDFVAVSDRVALYYREIWVHKLGQTQGELHTLMLVDGKVFAALGFWTDHLRRINTDYLFEQFGMCARIGDDPMPTRLMMLAITSQAFKEKVIDLCGPRNRYFEMNGLRTVCLSKYRKVKHNTGIFDLLEREKLPNGLYKLTYQIDFRPDTFSDVIARYLKETAEKKEHLGIR